MSRAALIISALLSLSIFTFKHSLAASAPYSQDTGKIVSMYTSPGGDISFTFSNNFANAVSTGQCPSSIGWAGNSAMSNTLKAALIAAKSNDLTITVTISGCEAGSWFKLLDIYW